MLLPELDLIPLDEVALDLELDEPFHTFEENALAKARAVLAVTRMPVVADDSGLEVDALGGAPGVRSARYAGEMATDRENNIKLIEALAAVPDNRRICRYRCVAVFLGTDGTSMVAEGACEGHVVREGRGDLGFGYDPLVVPAGDSRTMGEIPLVEKLAFSHRGHAFRALRARLHEQGLI
jgi:XTP/dITP diphosphohydrolase